MCQNLETRCNEAPCSVSVCYMYIVYIKECYKIREDTIRKGLDLKGFYQARVIETYLVGFSTSKIGQNMCQNLETRCNEAPCSVSVYMYIVYIKEWHEIRQYTIRKGLDLKACYQARVFEPYLVGFSTSKIGQNMCQNLDTRCNEAPCSVSVYMYIVYIKEWHEIREYTIRKGLDLKAF